MGDSKENKIGWDDQTQKQFEQLIEKIPKVLQGTARDAVLKKARSLAGNDNRPLMNEKDLVDAFFEVTPFGFHGPLKTDMEDIQIDYTKYGHPR